jgi:hypothetical protein
LDDGLSDPPPDHCRDAIQERAEHARVIRRTAPFHSSE